MVRTITSGVSVVIAITAGKWPAPKITAAKTIANHIPIFVGFPSSVLLSLKIIHAIRVIMNNLNRTSSFIPP